jgi:2-haloalkanoic acid dehalogenase type II
MPLKAIVFDVYNTLFRNDTSTWMDTFRDICRIQEMSVSHEEFWNCWKSFEVRFRQTRTNLEHPEKSPPFKTYQAAWREAFVDAFGALRILGDADHAAQMCVDGLASREPFHDTLPFLEYAGTRWKTAVLTNADNASILPLLQCHGLSFDAVLTSEMVSAYKPAPTGFHRILKDVGVLAPEAIYVGDTLFDDVHGAKLAGMGAVWINRTSGNQNPDLLPPDYQVSGLEELMEILDSLKEVES